MKIILFETNIMLKFRFKTRVGTFAQTEFSGKWDFRKVRFWDRWTLIK